MTQSLEDYLEAIYLLCMEKSFTRIRDVSDKLLVSKPSVVQAIKELKGKKYLNQEKYGYIELTEEGEKKAKEILKKHTVLKDFFIKVLGVSEDVAEKDACKVEHILSEETFSKIKLFISKKGR